MSKHTPGPWFACCNEDEGYSHYVFDQGERAICAMCSNDPNDKRDQYEPIDEVLTVRERQANARLIAAAPDLADVAHMVLTTATVYTPPELVRAATAALRKAGEIPGEVGG